MVYRFTARLIASLILAICPMIGGRSYAQPPAGHVDIFAGLDFHYRDIYHNGRAFDILINVTPGVHWQVAKHTAIAGQVIIPVVNQYGKGFSKVRPGAVSISHQLAIGKRIRLKGSAGLFTLDRYGFDIKGMVIANSWLAFRADIGLTGLCSITNGWQATTPKRVTCVAGPDFWVGRWNLEFKALGGRFTFGDYGVVAEAWRHFRHVSIGINGGYSSVLGENAGFKLCVALPPYTRHGRRVTFRPETTFDFGYNNRSTPQAVALYETEPEQNDRYGWFDRDLLPWGPDTMEPEYTYPDAK